MSIEKNYTINSQQEMQALGEKIAKSIPQNRKQAVVFALMGELGSGKTTFVQGLAKGLGIKEKILSPTFVLMKRFKNFYHFDCYRVKKEDLKELGLEDIFNNPNSIVAIEWAENIEEVLPKGCFLLKFSLVKVGIRKVVMMYDLSR